MEKSKLALGKDEDKRKVSILTTSDVSEFEVKKKIKFGGPMTGNKIFLSLKIRC